MLSQAESFPWVICTNNVCCFLVSIGQRSGVIKQICHSNSDSCTAASSPSFAQSVHDYSEEREKQEAAEEHWSTKYCNMSAFLLLREYKIKLSLVVAISVSVQPFPNPQACISTKSYWHCLLCFQCPEASPPFPVTWFPSCSPVPQFSNHSVSTSHCQTVL